MTARASSVPAIKLHAGQWLAFRNASMNQRVVDVSETRDGQVRVHVDFGNGGEPGTLFFEKDEMVAVT